MPDSRQHRRNEEVYVESDLVDHHAYATRELRRAEVEVIERNRDALAGRVLELGCGAGRVTGHLLEVARALDAMDLSEQMVEHCRRIYPGATFWQGDIRDLSAIADESYEAIFAPFNIIDVLDDGERRSLLAHARRILVPAGLLIASSHNRDYLPRVPPFVRVLVGDRRRPAESLRRLPARVRNRRRVSALEREEPAFALRNDEAHDFAILHYYVSRDAQERQLDELGFELLECLDLDGREVPRGSSAPGCPELHYVARSLR